MTRKITIIRKELMSFLILMLLCGCAVDSDLAEFSSSRDQIILIFPENNSECKEGTILSKTETELTFQWKENSLSGGYLMTLTNLTTAEIQLLETESTQLSVILDRATPYTWNISSVLQPERLRSETWTFYNEGPELRDNPPSKALALSPVTGASISATSTNVNLRWSAEDLDDDIIGYDLYFGENSDPELLYSDLEEPKYDEIPVISGRTYYWKIVVKDSFGNESISDIFSFSVG